MPLLKSNEFASIIPNRPEKSYNLFVDRDKELSRYIQWCKSIRMHPGQILVVTGEAGVGKSSLLHIMRQIATEPTVHPILSDYGLDEGDGSVFNYIFELISAVKGSDLVTEICRHRARPSLKNLSLSAMGFGAGGAIANNKPEYLQYLKKIKSIRNIIIAIDIVDCLGYDVGGTFKWLIETSVAQGVSNLNFIVSVGKKDFQNSSYLKSNATVVEPVFFSEQDMLYYLEIFNAFYDRRVPKGIISRCNGNIGEFKKIVNGGSL